MPRRVISRLQTPKNTNGERTDIHLITSSDAVIVEEDNITLTEKLKTIGKGVIPSETQPSTPGIWYKIRRTE